MAEIGVQMFTLRRWTQTIEELRDALARVKEIGYDTIQASAFGRCRLRRLPKPLPMQANGWRDSYAVAKAPLRVG